jgi:hypothetical protein
VLPNVARSSWSRWHSACSAQRMRSTISGTRILMMAAAALFTVSIVSSCGGSPTAADSTATPGPAQDPAAASSLTFTADVQPLLNNDCVPCHGGSRTENGYSFTSYAGVMRAVSAGSANSLLVRVSQPGGLMYSQWRGSAAAKAETIRRWVVDFKAAQ